MAHPIAYHHRVTMLDILFIAGKDNHTIAGQHLVSINGHEGVWSDARFP